MRTAFLVLAWLISRAAVLWLLAGPHAWVNGDPGYYDASLAAAGRVGLAHTLVEYPLPGVGALAVPWLLASLTGLGFAHLLTVAALLTDAAFLVLLRTSSGPRWGLPCLVWVLGVPLLGATAYARFDLLPGVLAGVALLLLARRPGLALLAAGVATAVKLWPALLLPALLAGVRRPRAGLVLLLRLGAGVAVAVVVLAGWARLISPLTYQSDRGLQIEAVAATPAIVWWWRDPVSWQIDYAASKSFEVTGPGVGALLVLTGVATLLLVAGLLLAWWRVWRLVRAGDRLSADGVVWLALAAVTGFVVTGKVLSPQYLLWLLPMAAGGLAVVRERAPLVRWTALLLLATGLTQLVFPVWYIGLSYRVRDVEPAVLALVGRNLAMVVLLGLAVREVVRCLRGEPTAHARAEPAYGTV
ncbi:MAG: hypothetical protein ACXVW6_12540 [Nocardioidaceae bacterium]